MTEAFKLKLGLAYYSLGNKNNDNDMILMQNVYQNQDQYNF